LPFDWLKALSSIEGLKVSDQVEEHGEMALSLPEGMPKGRKTYSCRRGFIFFDFSPV
jgi:hypothetical protein